MVGCAGAWLRGSVSCASAGVVEMVFSRAVGQDANEGGWRCGCASGAVGAVDRWLSGSAGRSSAQAVIAQTL